MDLSGRRHTIIEGEAPRVTQRENGGRRPGCLRGTPPPHPPIRGMVTKQLCPRPFLPSPECDACQAVEARSIRGAPVRLSHRSPGSSRDVCGHDASEPRNGIKPGGRVEIPPQGLLVHVASARGMPEEAAGSCEAPLPCGFPGKASVERSETTRRSRFSSRRSSFSTRAGRFARGDRGRRRRATTTPHEQSLAGRRLMRSRRPRPIPVLCRLVGPRSWKRSWSRQEPGSRRWKASSRPSRAATTRSACEPTTGRTSRISRR